MWTGASVTSGVRSFGDSLASEVAGYKGTVADSASRGREKLEGNESGLKRLENLVVELAQKMAQSVAKMEQGFSEIRQERKRDSIAVMAQMDKMAQDSSELKQEIGAVAARMDLMKEGLQAAVWEARQFTVGCCGGKPLYMGLAGSTLDARQ